MVSNCIHCLAIKLKKMRPHTEEFRTIQNRMLKKGGDCQRSAM